MLGTTNWSYRIYTLMEVVRFVSCSSEDHISGTESERNHSTKMSDVEQHDRLRLSLSDFYIPTRKRTARERNITGQHDQPHQYSKEPDVDGILRSTKKRKGKFIQPDLEVHKKKPFGFYTIEEKAKRMANNKYFRRTNQLNTFEEAFEAAILKLRKQKSEANRRFLNVESSSGVVRRKRKDYHRPGHSTKESIISRKTVTLLKERNSIFKHDKAREKAEEWYKDRNMRIKKSKIESRRKAKETKKEI